MSWQEQSSLFLRSHLPPGSRLLVAVSGGPDSMALAHFLRSQPYALVLGHVDHQLRAGSKRDALFVTKMARTWDLPVRVSRADVRSYARTHRMGLEEAARTVRYQKLLAMAKATRSSAIVTAHTANDQAETVLLHFLRGAGPAGLAGIPSWRLLEGGGKVRVIRPLLHVRRSQIMAYLRAHGLPYRTDSSNRSLQFSRNRIRHSTLPSLGKDNPGLTERLVQSADIFRQEEEFWRPNVLREARKTARQKGQRIMVVLPRLLRYHKALSRRILRHLLPGVSFQDIDQVLTLASGPERAGWLDLSGPWRVKREKTKLIAAKTRMG